MKSEVKKTDTFEAVVGVIAKLLLYRGSKTVTLGPNSASDGIMVINTSNDSYITIYPMTLSMNSQDSMGITYLGSATTDVLK